MKSWHASENEPAEWSLSGQAHVSGPAHGSFLLLAHEVDATFGDVTVTPVTHPLTTNTVGNGTVVVEPSATEVVAGDVVTLHAVADAGHVFVGWSGALTGDQNPASVTILGSTSVTAHFVEDVAYTVSASTIGEGHVTISPQQAHYRAGDTVTLTAS